VIVVIGATVFLIANLPNGLSLISKSKHVDLAREIASKQIEDKRTIKFANLVNDNSPIVDSRLNLLPNSSGTVVVADCDSSVCTNGEHIKQISVSITWTDNNYSSSNKLQNITLKTMIGEGGVNQ